MFPKFFIMILHTPKIRAGFKFNLRFQKQFQVVVGGESLQEWLASEIEFGMAAIGIGSGSDGGRRELLLLFIFFPPFVGTRRKGGILQSRIAAGSVERSE